MKSLRVRIRLSRLGLLILSSYLSRSIPNAHAFSATTFLGKRQTIAGVKSRTTLHARNRKGHTNSVKVGGENDASVREQSVADVVDLDNRIEEIHRRIKAGDDLTQTDCDDLLTSCASRSSWDTFAEMLNMLKQHSRAQAETACRTLLHSCYDASDATTATKTINAMKLTGMDVETSDLSLVVRTICRASKTKSGLWKEAVPFVEANDNLENSAYDSILSCMTYDRQWKDAIRLLRRLEQGKTKPGLSTYRIVIQCCVSCNQAEQAIQTLMTCIRHGITPSVGSFELVISALSKKLQWRRALQLFETMDQLKVPRTLAMFNSVLGATAKAGEVIQAKNLLQRMKKDGVRPSILSYNAVMSACASSSQWKDALTVLDSCHREPGISPDIYTYTHAIRACAKGGKIDRALALLQVAKDKRLPIDAYCYTAAIEACAKAKMWRKALELLDEMEQKEIAPTEVTYSVTITACGNAGNWQKSLELLDVMRAKQMAINIITYNAAIAALSKGAKQRNQVEHIETWQIALDLLEKMKQDGIEPDGFSFSSAISCCGTYGRWEEALKLIDLMKKGGPRTRPNKIAYTAAISSCGRSGQVDHAISLFHEMTEQGLAADRVAYNALFTALRVAGKCDKAFELWQEMVGKQAPNRDVVATARNDDSASPDIITVTEVVGALTREQSNEKIDTVFDEAVQLGIVLRSDSFDTNWEVDLTKMSLSVARAACRFVLKRAAVTCQQGRDVEELVFITGVGRNMNITQTSLRDFVKDILLTEFEPPLASSVPRLASGTVVVDKETMSAWIRSQS